MIRITVLGPAALLLHLFQATQPAPQFSTEIRLVHVDVAVFDERGLPVRDLASADFQVYEDAREVRLAFVRRVQPSAGATAPDEQSSVGSAVSFDNIVPPDGRALAIVLDADQIGFRPRLAARTRKIASSLIDGLEPGDFAAVVTVGGRPNQQSDFTRSKPELRRAVELFMPTAEGSDNSAIGQFERATHSLNAARTLSKLLENLKTIDNRRKAIVFVSEGGPFDVAEPSPRPMTHEENVRSVLSDLIVQAKREGVPFYTFDPREMSWPLQPGQRTLQWLSHETGGIAAVNTNTSETEVRKVLDATAVHYVLGYYSEVPSDRSFHDISVRVTRPDAHLVRARQGFVARPVVTSLVDAVSAALPLTNISLRVVGVPFPSEADGSTGVAVGLEIDATGETQVEEYEGLMVVTDLRGDIKVSQRLQFGEECARPASSEVVKACAAAFLEPDRYMIRVAVRRLRDGAVGSAFSPVDLPGWSADFAVSSVAVVQGTTDAAVRGQAPFGGVPTRGRSIRVGEPIYAAVLVRANAGRPRAPLTVFATLEDRNGFQREIGNLVLNAEESAALGGTLIRIPIPTDLAGQHLLSVQVGLGSRQDERRTAALIIR